MIRENGILIGLREAIQTPGSIPFDGKLEDPNLQPPSMILETNIKDALSDLVSGVSIELPSPLSCPSATKMVYRLVQSARKIDKGKQTPIHIRMTERDFNQAVLCGAEAVNLFGNSSNLVGNKVSDIDHLLSSLAHISDKSSETKEVKLRASLEHAVHTDRKKIHQFISGIEEINFKNPGKIVDLGLPDTIGSAELDFYIDLLSDIGPRIRQTGLRLNMHLHDDFENALSKAYEITAFCLKEDIPVVIETVPNLYPGERVGIRPTFEDDISMLGMNIRLPQQAVDFIGGNTWKTQNIPTYISQEERNKWAKRLHVAGVHTSNMAIYSNGNEHFPAPGLYGVMGKWNIGFIQVNVLKEIPSDYHILQNAALLARELAYQEGNKPQSHAIALAEIALQDPQFIFRTASSFGMEADWLVNPLPDLSELSDSLEEGVKERWG